MCFTHSTAGINPGPLHGNSDAVEEDDEKNHMVKHFVGDDLIANYTEPVRKERNVKVIFHINMNTKLLFNSPSHAHIVYINTFKHILN